MTTSSPADVQPSAERFAANLAAFKERAPALHGRLAAITAPHSELVLGADGGVDLSFLGHRFYGVDARKHAAAQVEGYLRRPLRRHVQEPDPNLVYGVAGDFCTRLTGRLAAEGIGYDVAAPAPEGHFLAVFGIGLGFHLEALVEATQCRVLVLIEPNIENLYHSLFVLDWQGFFARRDTQLLNVGFIVEKDPVDIAFKARQMLRSNNPALLDGLYVFTHYASSLLEQAKDRLMRDIFLTLRGLGFFEDELVMTRNAAANLARDGVALLSNFHPPRPEPLFIVGSGPSLDREIEFIKAQAANAVVLSIGSALRVLRRHGLRPDFHVEIENTENIVTALGATAAEFDLGGTTLVAAATVRPEVVAHFERAVLFFRERNSATAIFGQRFRRVAPSGPTVANAALVVAARLGFREIYLIGVDMGSKVEGRHHASDTIFAAGVLPERRRAELTFPGNFGGDAAGESILNWSRHVLEGTLSALRGLKVFNLSDGVRIHGALPKVSRAVELAAGPIDRDGLAAGVARGLCRYTPALRAAAWASGDRRSEADRLFERILAVLDEAAAAAPAANLEWVHRLYRVLREENDASPVAMAYLYGTLLTLLGSLVWYRQRVADPARLPRFHGLAIEELRTAVLDMRARLGTLYDEVDQALAAGLPLAEAG